MLALPLNGWIKAIQGVVEAPECSTLAAPLQSLCKALPAIFAELDPAGATPFGPAVQAWLPVVSADRTGL